MTTSRDVFRSWSDLKADEQEHIRQDKEHAHLKTDTKRAEYQWKWFSTGDAGTWERTPA